MSESLPPDISAALALAEARLAEFGRLRFCAEVASTNDLALSLAASGAVEGTAVLADSQRAGRGRRGRSWFSPPGAGLYLSIILRPGPSSAALSLVTLAAGVAVAEAVTSTAKLPVELKWPNDLVLGRPWRKLAGVLCESAGVGARVDAVVVGIGINLRPAAYPADIADRATSIETELGRPIDRAPLVVECLARLREVVTDLRAGRHEEIRAAWRRFGRAGLDGTSVRWQDAAGERRGVTRDIAADGALIIDVGGRMERLIAGEVAWEGLARE